MSCVAVLAGHPPAAPSRRASSIKVRRHAQPAGRLAGTAGDWTAAWTYGASKGLRKTQVWAHQRAPAKAEAARKDRQRIRGGADGEGSLGGDTAGKGASRRLHAQATAAAKAGRTPKALELLAQGRAAFPLDKFFAISAAHLLRRRALPADVREARRLYAAAVELDPADSRTLQAWAVLESKHGDAAEASRLFADAVAADPSHLAALQAWGLHEQAAGNAERGQELLKQAAERHSPEALQALGQAEERSGKHKAAARLYTQATEADARHGPSWTAWALLTARLGAIGKARKLFDAALAADAQPAVPLLNAYAHTEARHGGLSKARRLYSQALELEPGRVESLLGLGALEARAGNVPKAVALYEKALETEPCNVKVRHTLAQLHVQLGDDESARRILEELLAGAPGNARVRRSAGELAQGRGEFKAAAAHYQAGMDSPGMDALLCFEAYAGLQEFLGEIDEAKAVFRAGEARLPGGRRGAPSQRGCHATGRFLRMWALFERRRGSFQAARELFAEATAAAPRDERTWLQWGLLERKLSAWDEARRVFQRGVKVAPSNAYMWQSYAVSEAWAGHMDAARSLFERGIANCPKNAALRMEFALMEGEAGNFEEARVIFRRAVDEAAPHPPLYSSWAHIEQLAGRDSRAAELQAKYREQMEQQQQRHRQQRQGARGRGELRPEA
eukprot:jgi/Tetstr1/453689/TSEL_040645.t1